MGRSHRGNRRSSNDKDYNQMEAGQSLFFGTGGSERSSAFGSQWSDIFKNSSQRSGGAADQPLSSSRAAKYNHESRSREDTFKDELISNGDNSGGKEEEEVYIVKQSYGYLSILFSLAQTVILIVMMSQCGVAPMNINPMVGPYPDALSEWGGKNAVNILEDGENWRLLTPIMLHAGVIHLLCNVAVQLDTGAFFEREWGSWRWLVIYLGSAVGSSILSVIVMPQAVSVGSSGAVMGLFGGKLAEVICRCCEPDQTEQERIGHQVRKEQCVGVTCSVIVVMLFSFIPYVDWAAHLGGLIAGVCIGSVIFSLKIHKMIFRMMWFSFGTTLTVAFFWLSLTYMYDSVTEVPDELRDVCGYYKEFFEDYECNCMREEHEG